MIDNQFYPTPQALAKKAWSLFTNKNVKYILEPSAGRADLLNVLNGYSYEVDCIESHADNIAVLKEKNYRVIDTDFLSFSTKKQYDRIIQNPPFNAGVAHALKAWDILINGEMVSIINASNIENPNTEDKLFLVSLIKKHGSVEFVEEAFLSPDTQRKTTVKVALIHLVKETPEEKFFSLDDMDLQKSSQAQENESDNIFHKELAVPQSTIKNAVIAFDRAAEAIKLSIHASAKANYYKSLVSAPNHIDGKYSNIDVTHNFNEEYDRLKKNAWASIINATEFTSKFSDKVVSSLESELDKIKALEFTERNILGLLEGLLLNKSKLDNQMLLDTFDSITEFHSNNRFVYRSYTRQGWKSNDKHRSRSFRLKHTRFILPSRSYSFGSSLGYEGIRMLSDFDKTFALLDGKQMPEVGLVSLFRDENFDSLKRGERLEATYFSCRYYEGVGSIHFFPTKKGKELIERFNRVVGRLRKWMPDSDTVSPAFWEQYDKAEKITKEMEKDPSYTKHRDYDFLYGLASIDETHINVCKKLNIPIFDQIGHEPQSSLALDRVA